MGHAEFLPFEMDKWFFFDGNAAEILLEINPFPVNILSGNLT